jgi:hypothetical protein
MSIGNFLKTCGIFYDHLLYFVFIWYIFSDFGIIYPKNLATLVRRANRLASFLSRNDERMNHRQGISFDKEFRPTLNALRLKYFYILGTKDQFNM